VRFQVIGVVGDVKQSDLTQPIDPTIYTASRQPLTEALAHGSRGTFTLTLAIRTAGEPTSVAQAASAAIHEVDPDMPV
jgi:hypothetical protein